MILHKKPVVKPLSKVPLVQGEKVVRPFAGPRIWMPMDLGEVKTRLARARSYREWAIFQGLGGHVASRTEVEGWLVQAGQSPKLSDVVFGSVSLEPEEADDLPS